MDEKLKTFYYEIEKYSEGVHYLNAGIDYNGIRLFEEKYGMNIPNALKEFLHRSPLGNSIANR